LVEVPKGKDKPYQTNKNQFLIRVGSTNRIATQQEIQRLFQNSGFFHFDSVAVEKSNIKDIDLNRLSQYFENYSIDINHENNLEQLLRNIDIIDSDSEKLTIAGNLVFGLRPEKFMPNAGLTIASFKGNELSEDLLHYQKIDGTLPNQVDQALNTIKSIVSTASYIEGLKRVNLYESYSDKLWREILVNAVVHRDYSITGSRIRILKYDDRIEFRSPGRLANTVNLEKIKFGVSYSRNPVIVKFMENLRYIDQLGRGIPLVIKEISQKGGKIDFQEIGEEFVVIVYFPKV
ncbi:MAG TPA: ATP-binding protein, partial [Saprospiraceae bacterium]|nr:ATP-binding protein [Saprospiraceae bacterium]